MKPEEIKLNFLFCGNGSIQIAPFFLLPKVVAGGVN